MAELQKDNLVIPQGTTWAVRWPIVDATGNPVDTLGWTVRSQIRAAGHDDDVLYEWSTDLGNATVFNSFVELRVKPEESSTWTWGFTRPVVYDVEITNASNEVIRVTQGTITVSREITR